MRLRGSESGFSLMEAIVATAIAVIAVLGLAYSFGQGRAMIGRYEISRAAQRIPYSASRIQPSPGPTVVNRRGSVDRPQDGPTTKL